MLSSSYLTVVYFFRKFHLLFQSLCESPPRQGSGADFTDGPLYQDLSTDTRKLVRNF